MWIWLSTPSLATPLGCDATTPKEDFEYSLLRAEQAIGMLDPEELGEATDKARAQSLCLEVELAPTDVARLYRLSGIARYVNDDLVTAVNDFGVARALDPDAPIDPALGKPLRQTFEAVPPSSGDTMPLPRPTEGWLDVDGSKAVTAPADRDYFLQWIKDDGQVHGTWLVEKGQVPPYPTKGGDVTAHPGGDGHDSKGKILLISGLATVVAGGGSMLGSWEVKRGYLNSKTLTKNQVGTVVLNRVLGYGGIGLEVAGAGLVGVSFAAGF